MTDRCLTDTQRDRQKDGLTDGRQTDRQANSQTRWKDGQKSEDSKNKLIENDLPKYKLTLTFSKYYLRNQSHYSFPFLT